MRFFAAISISILLLSGFPDQAAPLPQTSAYLDELIKKISAAMPLRPNEKMPKYSVDIEVNFEPANANVTLYERNTFEKSHILKSHPIKVNLGLLSAVKTEGQIIVMLSHEMAHGIVARRNTNHSPDPKKVESETDHLAYGALVNLGIDPSEFSHLLDNIRMSSQSEKLRIDPIHYPLGFFPSMFDSRDRDPLALFNGFLSSHPNIAFRTQIYEYRKIHDDLKEKIQEQFNIQQIPASVQREILEARPEPGSDKKNNFETKLTQTRFLTLANRSAAITNLLFDLKFLDAASEEETQDIDSEYLHRTLGELAQVMRILSFAKKTPENIQTTKLALRLIDAIIYQEQRIDLLDANLRSAAELDVAIPALLLEGLQLTKIYRNELRSNENWNISAKAWIEKVRNKPDLNYILKSESSFSALVCLSDPEIYQTLNTTTRQNLIRTSKGKFLDTNIDDITGAFKTFFSAEQLPAHIDSLLFSPELRPALEAYQDLTINILSDSAVARFMASKDVHKVKITPEVTLNIQSQAVKDEDSRRLIVSSIELPDLTKHKVRSTYAFEGQTPATMTDISEDEEDNTTLQNRLHYENGKRKKDKWIPFFRALTRIANNRLFHESADISFKKNYKPFEKIACQLGLCGSDKDNQMKARIKDLEELPPQIDWRFDDAYFALAYIFQAAEASNSKSDYLEMLHSPEAQLLEELRAKIFTSLTTPRTEKIIAQQIKSSSKYEDHSSAPKQTPKYMGSDFYPGSPSGDDDVDFYSSDPDGGYGEEGESTDIDEILKEIENERKTPEKKSSFEEIDEEESEMLRKAYDPRMNEIFNTPDDLLRKLLYLAPNYSNDQDTSFPGAEKWLVFDVVHEASNFQRDSKFLLASWKEFVNLLTERFMPLLNPGTLHTVESFYAEAFEKLQRRIETDSFEPGENLDKRIDTIITMARINPRSGYALSRLFALTNEIYELPSQADRDKYAAKFLDQAQRVQLPLEIEVVDNLSSIVVQRAANEIRSAGTRDERKKAVERTAQEIVKLFKDSPYYYTLDRKIDELMETITATKEEAELLGKARTFSHNIEIDDLFSAETPNDTVKLNKTVAIADMIVRTMGLRTAEENGQVREFIIRGDQGNQFGAMAQSIANSFQGMLTQATAATETLRNILGIQSAMNQTQIGQLLKIEFSKMHQRFKRLPQGQQIILASMLATTPGADYPLIESSKFMRNGIDRFLLKESGGAGGFSLKEIEILAEEFLKAMDSYTRALLMSKAEIQNTHYILSTAKSADEVRADRIVNLLGGLGPLGWKIAQLLARWPKVPPILRERLKKAEDRADVPPYDELYKLLLPHLTEKEKADLERIFGVRAGSIKITDFVRFMDQNGEAYEKVFSKRRPHVRRLMNRVFKFMVVALENANARANGFFTPYLDLPIEAFDMVTAELDFKGEVSRMQEAEQQYQAAKESHPGSLVKVIKPERHSTTATGEEAIVTPFISAVRLDELPRKEDRLKAIEDVVALELELLLKDDTRPVQAGKTDEIKIDSDRHQGNIPMVVDREGRLAAEVHLDFGQWSGISRNDRNTFLLALSALSDDYASGDKNFSNVRSLLEKTSGTKLTDNEWWAHLKTDLQSGRMTEENASQLWTETVTGMLHLRAAIKKSNPQLGSSLFRLTKTVETIGGLIRSEPEGFSIFRKLLSDKIGDRLTTIDKLSLLAARSQFKAVQKVFKSSTPINIPNLCKQNMDELAEKK